MDFKYSDERDVLLTIAYMKAYNVKKVVASPGGTNVTFVASIQQDPFFEIYSCVDERSAAYMACGLAAESGEVVAISCTGATASRNYMPGLTEAFYRKLPVLAITSTQPISRVGQNIAQVIDRSVQPRDIVKLSVHIPQIKDSEDEKAVSLLLNKAFLELHHHGDGPVHINLTTTYSTSYTVKSLPNVQVINRICYRDALPKIPASTVGIYVGAHKPWRKGELTSIEEFCKLYNGVVLCDHTSNYNGKYGILAPLVATQALYDAPCRYVDLLIDLGDVSGAYFGVAPKVVWRVNPDGELRQRFSPLTNVFEMSEKDFFNSYIRMAKEKGVETVIAEPPDESLIADEAQTEAEDTNVEEITSEVVESIDTEPLPDQTDKTLYERWVTEDKKIREKIPELPFSQVWTAKELSSVLPANSVLHLGILNSIRSWNFFNIDNNIRVYANTGGFGIDGNLSSVIGASLVDPAKLYFLELGDLSFFYDLNSVGNRHIGNNLRILMINNGRGAEFRHSWQPAFQFGDATDKYIAAAGHYGNQSSFLVKHYAEDLGYKYLSAFDKKQFKENMGEFVSAEIKESIIFEVFTDYNDESKTVEIMRNLVKGKPGTAREFAKRIFGRDNVSKIKSIIRK